MTAPAAPSATSGTASEPAPVSSTNSHAPTPVMMALSAGAVIFLMLIAFMIGACVCKRYASMMERRKALPAFLKGRSNSPPGPDRKQPFKDGKASIPPSPMLEKDEDGFETRFIVPTLGFYANGKAAGLASSAPNLLSKRTSTPATSPVKMISSVARGLASSRGTGVVPPVLKYEEIIASPIITSPSAIFSPEVSSSSTHSPRDIQRWTNLPSSAPNAGSLTGKLVPDTPSARNSPALGPSSRLRVMNGGSVGSHTPAGSVEAASMVGLGLMTDSVERSMPIVSSARESTVGAKSMTAEVHEDELHDFTMASVLPSSTLSQSPEKPQSSTKPAASLSVETLEQLTWRDVPEGSLRSGSPLRVDSCDNLTAISPSSSGLSLMTGRAAVPKSVLRALQGYEGGEASSSETTVPSDAEITNADDELPREIPRQWRAGQHGSAVLGTKDLPLADRRQHKVSDSSLLDYMKPSGHSLRRPDMIRRSTQISTSSRSDDLIVLSGIAMDGISPIDMPSLPLSLWSTSASAPALASYAATLANLAANGASAITSMFPGTLTTACPIPEAEISPTEQLSSTPTKTFANTLPHASPSSSQMSQSSSAHSVLLLREQRLRSNLQAIQRAESQQSLAFSDKLSPADALRNPAGTPPKSQTRKQSASSLSLNGLSIREPTSSTGKKSLSPRKGRDRNVTPTATSLVAVATANAAAAAMAESFPRGIVGHPYTGVPGSCGSTPAASRSMDTIDTRASSPTPLPPFSFPFPMQDDRTQMVDAASIKVQERGQGGQLRALKYIRSNDEPLSSMLAFAAPPSTTVARVDILEDRHLPAIYDGAMLALQEKEQQRVLAQHLLGMDVPLDYPVDVGLNEVIEIYPDEKQVVPLQSTSTSSFLSGQGEQVGDVTQSSASLYSHLSASAGPSPTPNKSLSSNNAVLDSMTGSGSMLGGSGGASSALRDSTNSLVGHGFRLSGLTTGSTPSSDERGSYISPTLKLIHFYSPSAGSAAAAVPVMPGHTLSNGSVTMAATSRRHVPSAPFADLEPQYYQPGQQQQQQQQQQMSGQGVNLALGLQQDWPMGTSPAFSRPAVRADDVFA
ncbi:hypothetical protein OC846_002665 [Tilletia horrida]|uniref:Uncharacterized protein n=1 Tax=Tilletia horrida TaxID=155126 RepID=A0AAN6GRT8_9BASI|nr:hypothetical protein OC846_002665 [Tilletia horrida]